MNENHFRLLRLAIYRGLTCEQLSPTAFRVSSSRRGRGPYVVDVPSQACPCDATLPCSHLAIATDRWFEREADLTLRGDYFEARRLDFGGLPGRGDLKADDRRLIRTRAETVETRLGGELVAAGAGAASYRCPF